MYVVRHLEGCDVSTVAVTEVLRAGAGRIGGSFASTARDVSRPGEGVRGAIGVYGSCARLLSWDFFSRRPAPGQDLSCERRVDEATAGGGLDAALRRRGN